MSRRGAVLFAALCVIWGIPYLLIRVAVSEVSPAFLVFVRTGLAALLLLPLAARRGQLRPLLAQRRWLLGITTKLVAGFDEWLGVPGKTVSQGRYRDTCRETGAARCVQTPSKTPITLS